MFGVPLEVATKQTRLPDGVELPRVFREGIFHIDENCKFMVNNEVTKCFNTCTVHIAHQLLLDTSDFMKNSADSASFGLTCLTCLSARGSPLISNIIISLFGIKLSETEKFLLVLDGFMLSGILLAMFVRYMYVETAVYCKVLIRRDKET